MRSCINHHLESAVRHALDVKRHIVFITHVIDTRILHNLGVHLVPVGLGFIDDVGEDYGLTRLEADALGERHAEGGGGRQVVAEALLIVERAVVALDLAGLPGDLEVVLQLFL